MHHQLTRRPFRGRGGLLALTHLLGTGCEIVNPNRAVRKIGTKTSGRQPAADATGHVTAAAVPNSGPGLGREEYRRRNWR